MQVIGTPESRRRIVGNKPRQTTWGTTHYTANGTRQHRHATHWLYFSYTHTCIGMLLLMSGKMYQLRNFQSLIKKGLKINDFFTTTLFHWFTSEKQHYISRSYGSYTNDNALNNITLTQQNFNEIFVLKPPHDTWLETFLPNSTKTK